MKTSKNDIIIRMDDYIDFVARNTWAHTTTYVWCNDDGDLFGDFGKYDGCHRIGFADYSDLIDDLIPEEIIETGKEWQWKSANEEKIQEVLIAIIEEADDFPKIGETDDGCDILLKR